MTLRVGSLFTGYGGFDLAIGGELAWYSEIDKAACQVLATHHPNVPNLGDITKINWADVEPVDILTGGYPCQPFSHAGNRKGKNDERHLWPYVLDAICAIRPRLAILENVSGHLSLGFDIVLTDLAKVGLSAQWGTFRASDVGAPHRRERLFIVAYSDGKGLQGQRGSSSKTPTRGHGLNQPSAGSPTTYATRGTRGAGQGRGLSESEWSTGLTAHVGDIAADTSGERHGRRQRPASVERVGSSSDGSGWQTGTSRQESGARGVDNAADTAGTGKGHDLCERGLPLQSGGGVGDVANTDWGKYAPAIQRWATVLDRPAPAPTVERKDKRRLNPQFVEWMMGLPQGWVTGHGLSAAQELKMLGNGVVPQQAHAAITQLLERTQP